MTEVLIGIGSNLGNRENNIKAALDLIGKKCKILKISSICETEPLGYKAQGLFLNCAIQVETGLEPEELLGFLQSIEKKLGRTRVIKNGPRTIDLDILFYVSRIINEANLIIPHPRLHERLFVLQPLSEICPDFVHPELKKSIGEIRKSVGTLQAAALHSIVDKSKNRKVYKERLS